MPKDQRVHNGWQGWRMVGGGREMGKTVNGGMKDIYLVCILIIVIVPGIYMCDKMIQIYTEALYQCQLPGIHVVMYFDHVRCNHCRNWMRISQDFSILFATSCEYIIISKSIFFKSLKSYKIEGIPSLPGVFWSIWF